MAIRTQRWQSDACANPATGDVCSVLETWDDSVDPGVRVHSLKTVEKICSLHAGLTGLTHYNRLYDENTRKNKLWAQALVIKSTLDPSQWTWNFDSGGVLHVDFGSNLTANQKTTAQTWCNTNFGAGKVVIT